MPYDYTQEKTPIFTGINDNPQPATQNGGSNSSDLIAKVNKTLDELNNDLGSLETAVNNLAGANSASVSVNINNTDDTLWVKYLPYFAKFGSSGQNYVTASELDNAGTVDLAKVRLFNPSNGGTIDLKNFIEFNGIGFYFFLSGTFGGAYNDASDTQQGDAEVSLQFTENSAPKGVKILNIRDLLDEQVIDAVEWTDNVNGGQAFTTSGAYGGNSNTFMALEVQSTNFILDFTLGIG